MSSDYNVVCDKTKTYIHLGQSYSNGNTWFGYSRDDERGRRKVADFITEHINYGNPLRIVLTDEIPPEYTNYDCINRFYLEWRKGEDDFWKKESSTNSIREVVKDYFHLFNYAEIGDNIEYRVYCEVNDAPIPFEKLLMIYREIT